MNALARFAGFLLLISWAVTAKAVTPGGDELAEAYRWVQAKFLEVKQANTLEGVATYTTEPPFSFTYGGRPSAGLLGSWKLERDRRKLDEQRTEQTLTSTIGGWMPVGMYMMERVGQR